MIGTSNDWEGPTLPSQVTEIPPMLPASEVGSEPEEVDRVFCCV
ncbi:MAG: hypothetical protein P8Y74_18285 [Desulfobacterales bacterium]